MANPKRFLKRHILWVGLSAVVVPLLIILGLQYWSLVRLEQTSALAGKAYMKNFLEDVATQVEYYYHTNAERALSLPSTVFTQSRLSRVGHHFKQKSFKGVKQLFIADFAESGDSQVLFYNPMKQTLLRSCPDSLQERAVRVACAPYELLGRKGTIIETAALVVDAHDSNNRIILNPITDESAKVVGVVGMIVDMRYFKQHFLPGVIRTSLRKFFPGREQEHVIVTLHDGNDHQVFASQPVEGRAEEVAVSLPFAFSDWRLGIRGRDMTSEQWAQRYFAINLSLSVLMTIVLIGGIILALRTASREMKLSQMKTDFVSNVSHELRTPLSSVRVFGEFLRLGRVEDPEKIRQYGQYIENESRRLTQLINNILDFSKIDSGRKTYQFKKADVGEVITETLDTFRVRLKQSGFDVDFETSAEPLPAIMIDPDAISQAFINLLDNAVKYSGTSKRILVRLEREHGFIAISVSDHGVGIPREEQEKIFEKFHRVSMGLVHDVKGSGLGLPIVKHIVEAHRGKVTVASDPGQGSSFTIHLPVEEAASEGARLNSIG